MSLPNHEQRDERETAVEVSTELDAASVNDDALIAGLLAGQDAAAELLYTRLTPVIEGAVRRVFGVPEPDHDDLVQGSLEHIVRSLLERRFQAACSLTTWASLISERVAIDALRDRSRERNLFRQGMSSSPDVLDAVEAVPLERQLEARSELQRLQSVLSRMKPEHSLTLVMHDLFGHELAEIAKLTGVSPTAAQSRLVRGRKELLRRVACRIPAEHSDEVDG